MDLVVVVVVMLTDRPCRCTTDWCKRRRSDVDVWCVRTCCGHCIIHLDEREEAD